MVIKILPGNHKGIFSTEPYEIGQWIYSFNPHYIEQPTRTSIQYNNKHFKDDKKQYTHFEDDMGQYLNHHCEPNTVIVSDVSDDRGIHLIAIDIIKELPFIFEIHIYISVVVLLQKFQPLFAISLAAVIL